MPPYYDSMLAKLIIKATSYDLAVNKLERALKEFVIDDIRTTIPFLIAITKQENLEGVFRHLFHRNTYARIIRKNRRSSSRK